tara:strand:- start:10833 stop:11921 length:1089 start_codon:yes stop_codon:yes gene_type:complete
MEFFDDKEDVMDVIITSYGKYLIAKGNFKPEYYAFFDEGILYDSEWVTGSAAVGTTEIQNSIEDRIQNKTPRIRPPSVYEGVETSIGIQNEKIRSGIDNFAAVYGLSNPDATVVQDTDSVKIYNQETLQRFDDKFEFLSRPLGRSATTSDNLPAWNASMLKGEISQSSPYVSSSNGIEQIPQLDITLTYRPFVDQTESPALLQNSNTVDYSHTIFPVGTTAPLNVGGEIVPNEFVEIASQLFEDGTYISMQSGKIIIDLGEENVDYKKENFDVQVFISGSAYNSGTSPLQLTFNPTPFSASATEVERYISLTMDKQINHSLISGQTVEDTNSLSVDSSTTNVLSTREFLVRDLYEPEEDICE